MNSAVVIKSVVVCLIAIAVFCTAMPMFAEQNIKLEDDEVLPRSSISEENYQMIDDILSSENFARKKTVKRWRFKYFNDEDEEDIYSQAEIDAADALENQSGFVLGLASVLEITLWALLATVIVFVFLKYRNQIGEFFSELGSDEEAPELPTTMFGLDVKKTSMPSDVVQTARQYWLNGDHRQGIAALLQASLIALLHEHGCRFIDSDTESECCERIEKQASERTSAFMWRLVKVWQQVAYAHRIPEELQFDELCTEWREVF